MILNCFCDLLRGAFRPSVLICLEINSLVNQSANIGVAGSIIGNHQSAARRILHQDKISSTFATIREQANIGIRHLARKIEVIELWENGELPIIEAI